MIMQIREAVWEEAPAGQGRLAEGPPPEGQDLMDQVVVNTAIAVYVPGITAKQIRSPGRQPSQATLANREKRQAREISGQYREATVLNLSARAKRNYPVLPEPRRRKVR